MTSPNFNSAPGMGQAPVSKTKWIVQIIVGAICSGNIVTIILAVLGLVKADTDLETANKYYKWGWIAFVIGWALYILLIIAMFALGVFGAMMEPTY